MGNVFVVLGVFFIVLACAAFVAGQMYLQREKRRLKDYFRCIYGGEAER